MSHIPENLDAQPILEKVYAHFYNRGEVIFESDNPEYDFEIEKSEGVTFGVIVCAYQSEAPNNMLAKHIAKQCDKNTYIASVMVTKRGSMLVDVNTSKALLEGTFDFFEEDNTQPPKLSEDPQGFVREFMLQKTKYILHKELYTVENSPDPQFDLYVTSPEDGKQHLLRIVVIDTEYEDIDTAKAVAQSIPLTDGALIFVHFMYPDNTTTWDVFNQSDFYPENAQNRI